MLFKRYPYCNIYHIKAKCETWLFWDQVSFCNNIFIFLKNRKYLGKTTFKLLLQENTILNIPSMNNFTYKCLHDPDN